MDKDAVSGLSSSELASFPLDDFFDHYEKGLRKVGIATLIRRVQWLSAFEFGSESVGYDLWGGEIWRGWMLKLGGLDGYGISRVEYWTLCSLFSFQNDHGYSLSHTIMGLHFGFSVWWLRCISLNFSNCIIVLVINTTRNDRLQCNKSPQPSGIRVPRVTLNDPPYKPVFYHQPFVHILMSTYYTHPTHSTRLFLLRIWRDEPKPLKANATGGW